MNFRPELAVKVMAGEKTVTRRRMSDKPRSPWYEGGCRLVVGRDYSVCPGRTESQIGRVVVRDVRLVELWQIDEPDAAREGFATRDAFLAGWREINGEFNPLEPVWRIAFERLG